MDEYEAQIRCRFPRVVLVPSRTPGADAGGERFDAFVPPDRVQEFRSFVEEDLAALAERRGRPKPVIYVHCANQERSGPPAEFR